jgi:hypothetical protein
LLARTSRLGWPPSEGILSGYCFVSKPSRAGKAVTPFPGACASYGSHLGYVALLIRAFELYERLKKRLEPGPLVEVGPHSCSEVL